MENSIVDWQTYRSNLYQFIYKRINDSALAEDIVQDVLVKAYESRDSLRNSDKLGKWLFQIARNAVIDYYRTSKETDPLPNDLSGDEETVQNDVERELVSCLKPFIEQLPEHYRKAVKLSELEGLTQREVASVLELTESGAKSRVQRGREILESMLIKCCEIELDSRGKLMAYRPHQPCDNC